MEKYLDRASRSEIPLGRRFDFIAGTSTGGIIALALATGRTAGEIVQFYEKFIPNVFSLETQRILDPYHWSGRKYEGGPLRHALEGYFKNATLEGTSNNDGFFVGSIAGVAHR
jgi:uncharacterized protein